MPFYKADNLNIKYGAPSGDTVHAAISKIDGNVDQIITDMNTLDQRAPEYNTIWVPASMMVATTTNGAEAGSSESSTHKIMLQYFAFDPSTKEYVDFDLVLPDNAYTTPTVKVKFVWSSESGSIPSDVVVWCAQAVAKTNDSAIDASMGSALSVSDTCLGTWGADLQISGATSAFSLTAVRHKMIHFKVYRDATNAADTMDGEDAWLFGVFIQYKVDLYTEGW